MPPPLARVARITLCVLSLAVGAPAQLGLGEWVHLATDGSVGGVSEWSECPAVLANGVFAAFPQPLAAASRSATQTRFHSTLCSTATLVVELVAGRGGVRRFGVFVDNSPFLVALGSRAEAEKRLGAYRSTLCGLGVPIGPSTLKTFAGWIGPNVINSYNFCVSMAQKGLVLDAILSKDGDIITITMGYTRKDAGSVTFQRLAPSGPVQCRYLSKGFGPGFVLSAASGMHAVECKRKAGQQGLITVTVSTSAGARSFDLPELTPPTVEARLQQQVEGLRQAVEAANAVLQARVAALASELVSVKTSVAAAVASASATGSNSGGSVGAAALSLLQEQAAAAAAREHPVQPASVEEALQPAPAELQQSGSVVG